jgi:DNA-binding IclR family transcriptional regulator
VEPGPEKTARPAPIRSVLNALRIIERLSEEQPLGVSQLARDLGMPKTSTFRSLETLEHAGWARMTRDGTARWSLTSKAYVIGMSASPGDELIELAVREMSGIRDAVGETMHLVFPEDDDQVVVARVDGINPIRTFLSIGTRVPFHSTASGRAMLSRMPEDDVIRLLDHESQQYEFDRALVMREVEKARERGFAENFAEWRTEIAAVSAAVQSREGRPLAAISVSMPLSSFKHADRGEIGEMLVQAGTRISESLVQ